MKNHNPFRYFKTSPEIIRLAVMMYVRFPLSLRNVEDLLHERGIDIYATKRFAIGGTGSGRYLRQISESLGSAIHVHIQTGNGIWTRYS